MKGFEVLFQTHKNLITQAMYALKIYKDQEDYYQIGSIALWKACNKFAEKRGGFEMYAYSLIVFAILKEMTLTNKREEYIVYTEDEMLNKEIDANITYIEEGFQGDWYEHLTMSEKQLIMQIYVYGWTSEEISKFQNKSMEVIKKRRQRILRKIECLLKLRN